MRRRDFIALVGASAAAWPLAARAQQAAKVPHIAFVMEPALPKLTMDGIFQGLADHGFVDGKNIVFDWFWAPTGADFPEYAAKAVASKPAVIVVVTTPAAVAAKAATSAIPIVFTGVENPVAAGLIASFQRPGGNLTGNENGSDQAGTKKIEIAKQLIPNLTRVASVGQPSRGVRPDREDGPIQPEHLEITALTGVSFVYIDIEPGIDFEQMFVRATAKGAQAMWPWPAYAATNVPTLAKLAIQYRLPLFGNNRNYPDGGGLFGYGLSPFERTRRIGHFVDLILKGVNPGDIPVETPTKFELVINMKTAKAHGLTVPQSLLFQATELLE